MSLLQAGEIQLDRIVTVPVRAIYGRSGAMYVRDTVTQARKTFDEAMAELPRYSAYIGQKAGREHLAVAESTSAFEVENAVPNLRRFQRQLPETLS